MTTDCLQSIQLVPYMVSREHLTVLKAGSNENKIPAHHKANEFPHQKSGVWFDWEPDTSCTGIFEYYLTQ